MSDPVQLLARRNPVDERRTALLRRDARGAADLARIMAGPAPRGRGRMRRGVGLVTGTAGVAAGAAVVGALFLWPPAPGDRPATTPAGEWGLRALVTVEPLPGGLPLDRATARSAEVLRARAAAWGFQGVTAEVVGPGRIALTVPWAQTPAQITGLLVPLDLRLYDLDAVILADSARVGPAEALRVATARRPGPSSFYVVSPDARVVVSGPSASPPAVPPGSGYLVVRVPDVLRIIGMGLPPRSYRVVVDRPVATPDQVLDVSGGPAGLTVRTAVPVSGRRLALVVAMDGMAGGTVLQTAPPTRTPTAALVMPPLPAGAWLPRNVAGGGVAARLAVVQTRPVGDPPPRTGVRDAVGARAVLARLEADPMWTGLSPRRIRAATMLRTLDAYGYTVWEGLTGTGNVVLLARGPDMDASADCLLGPNARVIAGCLRTERVKVGRVAPGVARVEVRYRDGRVIPGRVRGGWFMVRAAAGRGAPRVVALSADGRELGSTVR